MQRSPSISRIKIKPGQESVWDYPRPPRVERVNKRLEVKFQGMMVADAPFGFRVLETSHPPTFYIPKEGVNMDFLRPAGKESYCEFKGLALYFDVVVNGPVAAAAAWSYPSPRPAFVEIKNALAFYPSMMDVCRVDGEIVQAQAGDFYGGWITREIVGPFKGGPGTWGW